MRTIIIASFKCIEVVVGIIIILNSTNPNPTQSISNNAQQITQQRQLSTSLINTQPLNSLNISSIASTNNDQQYQTPVIINKRKRTRPNGTTPPFDDINIGASSGLSYNINNNNHNQNKNISQQQHPFIHEQFMRESTKWMKNSVFQLNQLRNTISAMDTTLIYYNKPENENENKNYIFIIK